MIPLHDEGVRSAEILWAELQAVTAQRDRLLAAIALHKLVVGRMSANLDAQHDADVRLWTDAIDVLELDT